MAVMFKMATCADCNEIVPKTFSGDLNRCPTKAEIEAKDSFVISGDYEDNQLVNLADISLKPTLSTSPASWVAVKNGGTFTLNITCNIAWSVTYPSWCSGPTSGTGDASITVSVAPNSGHKRSATITITTSGPSENISKTCAVSQGGKPEIEIYVGELSSDGTYCNIEASQSLKDDLSIEISVVTNGNTSQGSARMPIGAQQTRCNIYPAVPDGSIVMSRKIDKVNGHRDSPFEADNAVYKWI